MDIVDRDLKPEERHEMDLVWTFSDDHDKRVFLDVCFIADVPPCEGTLARVSYDRMVEHTRATLGHRILSAAASFDRKVRADAERVVDRARAELERADRAWDHASALCDVLVGDRA